MTATVMARCGAAVDPLCRSFLQPSLLARIRYGAKKEPAAKRSAAWLLAPVYGVSSPSPAPTFHPRICAIFLSGTPRAMSIAATLLRILAVVTAPGISPAPRPFSPVSRRPGGRSAPCPGSGTAGCCVRERCPVLLRCRRGGLLPSPR